MLTACETLRLSEPKKAAEILTQLEQIATQAKVLEDAGQKMEAATQAEADSSTDCSEPTKCKGQLHHIISKRISRELEKHRTLQGHYKLRDPRFVTRAVDEQAHCGYQEWHRAVDEEVIRWLQQYRRATPEQFIAFLRELYSRVGMRARFPHGF
ncbi:Wall-associated protein precursor [Cystobacter fuscus]|uniref:Wall-associated protein n=1 Tax=Cystobacter fuscus TaxID=43 RepID=A0A250IUE1_9BACT|nr:Wall-associated protein precursor [Cystobacter fuscus]ATB34860.1 Wall-associated protein precursor [Cystobacter fuscus]